MRSGCIGLRSWQTLFSKDLDIPFYSFNRPSAKVSEGLRDSFWLQGMMGAFKGVYDCIKAFSETDFTDDLKRIDVPTLVMHGDDDQIVPIEAKKPQKKALGVNRLYWGCGFPHQPCTQDYRRLPGGKNSFALLSPYWLLFVLQLAVIPIDDSFRACCSMQGKTLTQFRTAFPCGRYARAYRLTVRSRQRSNLNRYLEGSRTSTHRLKKDNTC